MRKIAFYFIIMAIAISLLPQECMSQTVDEWLSKNSQESFLEQELEEARAHRNQTIIDSALDNAEDAVCESNLLARTIVLDSEITLTPFYEITYRSGRPRKYIADLEQKITLPNNNPAYRDLFAYEITELLIDNEVISQLKDDGITLRIVGCRITWQHRRHTYYLMDTGCNGDWDVAGRGDYTQNAIYNRNQFRVKDVEGLTQIAVHKMY